MNLIIQIIINFIKLLKIMNFGPKINSEEYFESVKT